MLCIGRSLAIGPGVDARTSARARAGFVAANRSAIKPPNEIPQTTARSIRRSSSACSMRATSLSIEHSGPSGNVITWNDDASAATAGRTYSHGPGMPGTSPSGGPLPCSTITIALARISVPERLPRLERVLDAFECLPFAAELEKRLSLEVEHLLLAHGGLMRQRPPGKNTSER